MAKRALTANLPFKCRIPRGVNAGLMLIALLLFCWMGGNIFQLSAARGHVWTAHLFAQSPELWDWVHENGRRMHAGGIWRYGDSLHNSPVLRYVKAQPAYGSVVDMACSVGIVLNALRAHNPTAAHFGSDISHVMVNDTAMKCRTPPVLKPLPRPWRPKLHCTDEVASCREVPFKDTRTAGHCMARQFDMGLFRAPDGQNISYVFPGPFDYVLISDVLFYISWGGWPPFFLRYCRPCRTMAIVLGEQKRFLDRIRRLTRREIVFSRHQDNPIAQDMLEGLGARYDAAFQVYLVSGTAGNLTQASSSSSNTRA